MNPLSKIFAIFLLALTSAVSAEKTCPYCGSWSPYGDLSKEINFFSISSQELSLLGCKPLHIKLSEFSNEVQGYSPPENATIDPATATYISQENLECEHDFGQSKNGPTIVRFQLRPRGIEGGEILLVSVSPLGGQPFLQFGAMRSDHNPCDEGTHFGLHICSLKP